MRMTARRAAFATATVGAVQSDGPVGFAGRIASIPAMVRDTLLGRWHGLGRSRLALLVLGVAYVVSPVDLLPEVLLTIPGLADDAIVAAWVAAALLAATGDYRDWRSGAVTDGYRIDETAPPAGADRYRTRTVPGHVTSAAPDGR